MHVCTVECLQLEGPYVGVLLCNTWQVFQVLQNAASGILFCIIIFFMSIFFFHIFFIYLSVLSLSWGMHNF